jgi:hypothetical protein
MSIQFDQVEGVVQREGEGAEPAQGSGQGQQQARPAAEQFETSHRRMEWITRRLMAD